MKLSILSLILIFSTTISYSQTNSGVTASFSIDDSKVVPSKGFVLPTVTSAERNAMPSNIADGIQVYDKTTKSVWLYNGISWVENASNNDVVTLGSGADYQPELGMIKYNAELDKFQGYTKKGWVNLH